MTEPLQDDVFGELIYEPAVLDDCPFWRASEYLALLGQTAYIRLEAVSEKGPTDEQKRVYQMLKERQRELKEALQEELFSFYREVRPGYLVSDEFDADVPPLDNSDQIWELLTPSGVLLPLKPSNLVGGANGEDFVISWETTWNPNYALHASYRDWDLISVDQD